MYSKCLGALTAFLLTPTLATADGVIVGDREWRQLTDTIQLTWSEVASVCNVSDGTCSGSVKGVSFDGWTLASIEDVQELFERLIKPDSTQFPTILPDTNYLAVDDPDIQAALGPGGFAPVPAGFGPVRTGGWTRSLLIPSIPGLNFAPYLVLDATDAGEDYACLYCGGVTSEPANSYRGNWMYRPATPMQVIDSIATSVAGVGPGSSLARKIDAVQAHYAVGDVASACATTQAFLNQVSAQSGRQLTTAEAAALISDAQALERTLGCQ